MSLDLRRDVHWCNCDGRAVFLDTKADRYFCLPKAANDVFLRLAFQETLPGDAERLQPLVARGVLVEAGAGARIRPPVAIEPPTCDVVDAQTPRAALLRMLTALACEASAAWALRTKCFGELIDSVRRSVPHAARKEQPSPRTITQIAAASAAVALLTRSHDRCLVRALAVHSMCIKSGVSAKLVFGVIAHPFTAHCWVQLGSAVIVGGYEQARLYTPILVIG